MPGSRDGFVPPGTGMLSMFQPPVFEDIMAQDIYTALGYDKDVLQLIVDNISRYYITYRIKKRNGKTRRIDAPQDPLKTIQKSIVTEILYNFSAHPIAHGFVKGKSPVTNAKMHVGKEMVLSIDIKNFFNSISRHAVLKTLQWIMAQQSELTYEDEDLILLSNLMCYNEVLPQGAPTSPVMSNLVCMGMDRTLSKLAKKANVTLTRYADDIVASGSRAEVITIRTSILSTIYAFHLLPNRKKTKIREYHQRQQVTGIVVNKKTSIKKQTWRNLRAQLYNLLRDGVSLSKTEFQVLRGRIEWIKSLNPSRGSQLLAQLSKIPVTQ